MSSLNKDAPKCKKCGKLETYQPMFTFGFWDCVPCKKNPPATGMQLLVDVEAFVAKEGQLSDIMVWYDHFDPYQVIVRAYLRIPSVFPLQSVAEYLWERIAGEFDPMGGVSKLDRYRLTVMLSDSTGSGAIYQRPTP